MLKFLRDKKKDNKGFTLVELVIVVAILAILVGILAPQYTKYVEKSRKAADAANLENMVTAFKTAASDGTDQINAGKYTITIQNKAGEGENATATTVKAEKADGSEQAPTTADNVITLLGTYAGTDWTNTKLKSSKWTASEDCTGAVLPSISAVLTVANDGSVNVTYNPTWVKNVSK